MSRFSTITSQHCALRDLERQRLERKMGQLRREIEGSDQVGIKAGNDRRFKPPRRRQPLATRCPSEAAHPSARSEEDASCCPGPSADVCGGERAQSVEMAWLWSVGNRMEEDAEKVASFLNKHGLDRYAALLADEPSGLGASLESLAQATDASLQKAGLPASPRRHLLDALREVGETASRPRSTASSEAAPRVIPLSARKSSEPQWGCLGRSPPGWSLVAPAKRLSSHVVQTADAGTDCDVGHDIGGQEILLFDDVHPSPLPQPPATPPSVRAHRPATLTSVVRVGDAMEARQAVVSRPTSAASRPGSSCGLVERVSCYQCYKQVLPKYAIICEDLSGDAVQRQLCSEACSEHFKKSVAARLERERQLSELRASVMDQGLGEAP